MPRSFRHDGLNDTYGLFHTLRGRTSRLMHMLFLRQIRYFCTLIGYTSSLLGVVSRLDVACKPDTIPEAGLLYTRLGDRPLTVAPQ